MNWINYDIANRRRYIFQVLKHVRLPLVATKLLEDKRDLARKLLEEKIESVRVIFGATPSKPRTPDEEWYYKRVSFV